MSKTPLTPTTSNRSSLPSTANKSKTVACYQPDKCFQFRKPTNFSNKRPNFNTLPTSRYLTRETSVKESLNSYPYSTASFASQTYPPPANTLTPKLFFQDVVSAYYGISEDPYCKIFNHSFVQLYHLILRICVKQINFNYCCVVSLILDLFWFRKIRTKSLLINY